MCLLGDIRLANGIVSNEGIIMVFEEYRWGTVCNHGFDNNIASLVCIELGYT